MKLKDFDYALPEELIAQYPCETRDDSRMMVVDRKAGKIIHDIFLNLTDYLKKGDALVFNDSKVISAKLIGNKDTGGVIELLLLRKMSADTAPLPIWEVLLKPAKRVRIGTRILFENNDEAVITERISDKKWLIMFRTHMDFDHFLNQYGSAPLPPYIKRKTNKTMRHDDIDRYQTIYARTPGSIAAPTAGLHFSHQMLNRIKAKEVKTAYVTLHVGYGTFVPIETDDVENHVMEEEYFDISQEAADVLNHAENVIAVGTTSTRVMESAADEQGRMQASSSCTDMFIYPGYRFKRVNTLLTNFHLPKSSLFLLVSAFAGTDLIQEAYRQAVSTRYRFYSYGDCMLIL